MMSLMLKVWIWVESIRYKLKLFTALFIVYVLYDDWLEWI